MLKFLGVGPSRYEYLFQCRDFNDEIILEEDKGIINSGEQSFDFLLKYQSWKYGEFKFDKI